MNVGSQQLHTSSAFWVGCLDNFPIYDFTADPFPLPALTLIQDDQDCFGFKMNSGLALIVKRSIQAANIEIDSNLAHFLYSLTLLGFFIICYLNGDIPALRWAGSRSA